MIWKNVRHALKLAATHWKVAARWDVLLERGVTLKYAETFSFGEHCTLQSGVYVYGSRTGKPCVFGHHVVLAAGAIVLGEGGFSLGAYTHLGPGVVLTTQYGDSRGPMATASPHVKTAPVRVGEGCWVGSGSVLMPGVTLGDECVVAPGSVVFGHWGDRVTLSGNPARPVRQSAFAREAS
jgi:acetyltransferase-like isoleucine patch superfamily enzyme